MAKCVYKDFVIEAILQPRPQGLLLDDFQNGGSSGESPGKGWERFHLPKNFGNSDRVVNGTRVFGSFHWKFSGKNRIPEKVRLQNSRIFCERERRTILERKPGASEKTARENGERRSRITLTALPAFRKRLLACEARALHTRGSRLRRFPPSENDCFAVYEKVVPFSRWKLPNGKFVFQLQIYCFYQPYHAFGGLLSGQASLEFPNFFVSGKRPGSRGTKSPKILEIFIT